MQSQRGHVLRLPFMWFGVPCLLHLRQLIREDEER